MINSLDKHRCKILNKSIINWIQDHFTKANFYDQVSFIPKVSIHKLINIIYYINVPQNKNHMIIPIDAESFWQNPFLNFSQSVDIQYFYSKGEVPVCPFLHIWLLIDSAIFVQAWGTAVRSSQWQRLSPTRGWCSQPFSMSSSLLVFSFIPIAKPGS